MQVFSTSGAGVTQVGRAGFAVTELKSTQVEFHPTLPQLFVASRHSHAVECFDVRGRAEPVYQLDRPSRTNQRLRFDISRDGSQLVAGDDVN
jgi:hypothetical protein